MRKKWTYVAIVSMMLGVAPVFTGCVDTDEPAGIENLRGAKAALLNAKAELELAKIELVKAQAEHERQNAAIAEAEADYRKAEAEYYRAKTEQEKLIWAEELKQKQAEVEAAIKAQQVAQAQSEVALVNAQKALAIAKASLTEQEYKDLWLYQLNINEAKARVDRAKTEYDAATIEYTTAMESYDKVQDNHEWKSHLQHEVEVAQYRYEMAVKALEDAKAWAVLPEDVKGWQARYDELEQKEKDLKTEKEKLDVQVEEWKAGNETAIAFNEAETAWEIAKGKDVKLEAYSYDTDLSVLNISQNMTIKDGEVTGNYNSYYDEPTSPDDSWINEYSSIGQYVTGLERNIQFFEGLKLDKNGEAWNEIRVNQAKADVTAKQKLFDDDSAPWKNAILGFNDGVTAKPEVLNEAIAVSNALTAYNNAVKAYNAAVADVAAKYSTATGSGVGLTADELTAGALESTLDKYKDIMEDGSNTGDEIALATTKYNAAKAYSDALDAQTDANNALNGYYDSEKGEWVKGAYETAQGKFYEYQAEYQVPSTQWDAVETAYNGGVSSKEVTAAQITAVIAVSCDNIENVIERRSYDLFGSAFGTRLVAVTGDELAAEIQEILSGYSYGDYYVVPTSDLVHWERYMMSVSDITEAHIKYFLLGGFELYQLDTSTWTFNLVTTYDFKTIGALEQAKSNVTRGEAFAKGNAAAVDAAVKYLTEVLDKATGEKGVLTLNNAEIDKLEAAKDEAEDKMEAAFEATGLAEEIEKNLAAQNSYRDLINSLKDLIEHCLGDFLEGSPVDGNAYSPDWEALQERLDMEVRLAEDYAENMNNLLIRAQKNLETYGTGEYDALQQASERLKAAETELAAANEAQQAAIEALQNIINTILASVQ